MDTLLAGAELDDVPVSGDCGSRLFTVAVVVVPSFETMLTRGVAILKRSVWGMMGIRVGKYVLQGIPDPGSMPPPRSVNSRPHSSCSAWSKRYLRAENSRQLLRSMPHFGELR